VDSTRAATRNSFLLLRCGRKNEGVLNGEDTTDDDRFQNFQDLLGAGGGPSSAEEE